ncbi:hypothetical protein [Candidatus Methylacidithermus pantelleriae]|uniref:Uncharacterized protein n=1 Tax=Candidatus Methylacidithermus pantelleriae TaxID=2744239 RepID=A0A8J2FW80_9BACT|nr:hypothetical protein [Candidatus Methylacidithermus pantelleriae]CAF0697799.1 hypothetical protein MPNT_230022 [Candidatus Methylacidithermus pantelleriae]
MIRKLEEKKARDQTFCTRKRRLAILRRNVNALLAEEESFSGCVSGSARAGPSRNEFSLEKKEYASHAAGKRDWWGVGAVRFLCRDRKTRPSASGPIKPRPLPTGAYQLTVAVVGPMGEPEPMPGS